MSKSGKTPLTRTLPQPGELWVSVNGSNLGRVIRIDEADDSHVTYTVIEQGLGSRSPRGTGRMTAASLRNVYRPRGEEG